LIKISHFKAGSDSLGELNVASVATGDSPLSLRVTQPKYKYFISDLNFISSFSLSDVEVNYIQMQANSE
jgi:hypothetical protein